MIDQRDPTVCEDCGAESTNVCPWDATTCSECSFIRERSVSGVSDVIPACPAHGAPLTAEDFENLFPCDEPCTDSRCIVCGSH